MGDLNRLLRPQTAVVIGGGVWGRSVIQQCRKIGFKGTLYAVHPKADKIEGIVPYRTIADLPVAPDAAFVGVNRDATIEVVAQLATKGAGGAVCFAAGFLEAKDENADGAWLQDALIKAAGDMPIIGPNCYGIVNYLDQFCLWPDQHGGEAVQSGVAIVTQSSNILINLTMQQRGLPIAYALTAGNQAQTSLSALGRAVLDDSRVTALGLHIEGIGDLADFEALARHAAALNKPIIALKVGRSAQAQQATISHTASLAGSDASADALFKRLGIARVDSLSVMIEALKILHQTGPLSGTSIASASCSGGEASLMADTALLDDKGLRFPALTDKQHEGLRSALGDMVALANPLDYHTYIWGDVEVMADCYTALFDAPLDLGVVVVDFPRADRCDDAAWRCVIEAASKAQRRITTPIALLASLAETMPEAVAKDCMAAGIVPLNGLVEGLSAIAVSASLHAPAEQSPLAAPIIDAPIMLDEAEAKTRLASFGLDVPAHIIVEAGALPKELPFAFPVVLKAMGLAHKSEEGGVIIGLDSHEALQEAMRHMGRDRYLIEEMISAPLAELLVGVVADPVHGYLMTLAAGGILTELLQDSVSLSLPITIEELEPALARLKIAPLFDGYRGKPAVKRAALYEAVMAIQACVMTHSKAITEIEVNPLILTSTRAVGVDALIREGETPNV